MLICLCIGKNMASAEETHVTDYNQNKDPFYEKATIYATWHHDLYRLNRSVVET